ncbi:unnamed protein product [Rotaria socialis]|uniref:Uncharacterized protein n=2 Tax=Rotaria socialis TaxID=392032 RepID=A0A820URV9_9BILA|nr:unnamed protein product [Rotaria socialis]
MMIKPNYDIILEQLSGLALKYYKIAIDTQVSSVPVDQYSSLQEFLNNPTFNIARWYKMSNNFELALLHYGNLIKTESLRKNFKIFVFDKLCRYYNRNCAADETEENHRLSFINFSAKCLPQFHIEVAEAYLSVGKAYEALEIFLKYAPSEEESINNCCRYLAKSSHAEGNFLLEIAYSKKTIEFCLKNKHKICYLSMLAFTYKIVADAYYSSGQSLLAIDHLKKAIQCFKESYDQGISPDKPYHGVVQKQHNAKIIECYNRLADIYRGIDNSEAADDAVRKTSTDLITIDDNLEHDLLIQDLAICHSVNLGPEALDQALIDALLMVQSQVKQTKIFKCLNGHELQTMSSLKVVYLLYRSLSINHIAIHPQGPMGKYEAYHKTQLIELYKLEYVPLKTETHTWGPSLVSRK